MKILLLASDYDFFLYFLMKIKNENLRKIFTDNYTPHSLFWQSLVVKIFLPNHPKQFLFETKIS